MGTLLQCYAADPALEADDPAFNTHRRMQRIGTFINGPHISFDTPMGDWINGTLLEDMMERALAATETPEGHVMTIAGDQIDTLLSQLHAAAEGEGEETDPEFIEEMIEAAEYAKRTSTLLWIGI